MSKLSYQVQVAAPTDEAKRICARAVRAMGWRAEATDEGMVMKPGAGLNRLRSRLELSVAADGEGGSTVIIEGSSMGVGPMQRRYLHEQLTSLCEALEQRSRAAA